MTERGIVELKEQKLGKITGKRKRMHRESPLIESLCETEKQIVELLKGKRLDTENVDTVTMMLLSQHVFMIVEQLIDVSRPGIGKAISEIVDATIMGTVKRILESHATKEQKIQAVKSLIMSGVRMCHNLFAYYREQPRKRRKVTWGDCKENYLSSKQILERMQAPLLTETDGVPRDSVTLLNLLEEIKPEAVQELRKIQ